MMVKMFNWRKITFAVLATLLALQVHAQRNCGTVAYNQLRNPNPNQEVDFEQWLLKNQRLGSYLTPANQTIPLSGGANAKTAPTYYIPVVVHVVHNGEPVGVGSNISESQILSQIEVLNEDFRRQNADTVETPAGFLGVAADFEIEFVLAKQDPNGLPTDGIVRVQGSRTSYGFFNDSELKGESYWAAEDYMNVWVANLSGGLLGWAQFPVSSLEGLEDANTNRLTDGVVIGHQYFGSIDKDPTAGLQAPWNLGRTATHEVGHFLGLRHIWGDGNCSFDDFVSDTPLASVESTGCPVSKSTCASLDMFQNYMDYTDDGCMNIFTEGQKQRVDVVMVNSPRRNTLPTSHALDDPVITNIDLGIHNISSPGDDLCGKEITPVVSVLNTGEDDITSFTISVALNGASIETLDINTNLSSGDSLIVTFQSIVAPPPGSATFRFDIEEVNMTEDVNLENNTAEKTVEIPEILTLPIIEDFESSSSWEILNASSEGWQPAIAPSWSTDNNALSINFRQSLSLGEESTLMSPVFAAMSGSILKMQFDYAYRYTSLGGSDILLVEVSTDCGDSFTPVFNASGESLSTVDFSDINFVPTGRLDWTRIQLDMDSLAGLSALQIRIRAQSAFGNTIYLDNLIITEELSPAIGIAGIVEPGPVFCAGTIEPKLVIENTGTDVIANSQLSVQYDNGSEDVITVPDSIEPGEKAAVSLPTLSATGDVLLKTNVSIPGENLALSSMTQREFVLRQNCTEIEIPFRQKFESENSFTEWRGFNTANTESWIEKSTFDFGESAFLSNHNQSNYGIVNYLSSPVLNLQNSFKASMFFDLSYGTSILPGESLRILISTDEGRTFPYVVLEEDAEILRSSAADNPWTPNGAGDWLNGFVNLSSFAGEKIIVVFEVTSRGSNDLYIDNIEFFQDDDPNPVSISQHAKYYPNPATGSSFNLTFNLPEKEEVLVVIMDSMGREVFRRIYPNSLNQTHPFDMTGNKAGIYLIQTISNSINEVTRIVIRP